MEGDTLLLQGGQRQLELEPPGSLAFQDDFTPGYFIPYFKKSSSLTIGKEATQQDRRSETV